MRYAVQLTLARMDTIRSMDYVFLEKLHKYVHNIFFVHNSFLLEVKYQLLQECILARGMSYHQISNDRNLSEECCEQG